MLNSMESDDTKGLFRLTLAKELWDTRHELDFDKTNMVVIYELKQAIASH